MIHAVLSDLHANPQALEAVLTDAAAQGAEEVVCLGDIVGYGPQPVETLRRIRETAATIVAGNHDDAVSGRVDASDFIDLAGEAVSRHRAELSSSDLGWLKKLPYSAKIGDALCVHGRPDDPESFGYLENADDAAACFAAVDAPLIFVGHTHVPGIFLTGASGKVYLVNPQDFAIEDGKRYIVNVGSVGYPRESGGKCLSCYVLYDDDNRTIRFRQLPFSVASVMARGKAKRIWPWLAAAGVALVAAMLAIAAVLRSASPTLPPPVAVRTIAVGNARHVRAQLKLEKTSPPAELNVVFTDAAGKTVGKTWSQEVRGSYRPQRVVPEGAVRAEFTVRAKANGAPPRIDSFAPIAE